MVKTDKTNERVEIGMIGLGRMGANMVRRLMQAGHRCVVFDVEPKAREALAKEGAIAVASLAEMAKAMQQPRHVWMMVPAAVVDETIGQLVPHLAKGDTVVDSGNSYYLDDIRRAKELSAKGLHYCDIGTSGGVWGLERGYCLMIGGDAQPVKEMDTAFATLSPGGPRQSTDTAANATAKQGYLYCGKVGAGHFVKMVHNGIEYGLMAAYAEGLNLLKHANVGSANRKVDAETAPLRNPEHFNYELDLGAITEVWRHGSVISSWLLDLTAEALGKDGNLSKFAGHVSDSGEGRWTIDAAIEASVPVPILATALFSRFSSRGEGDFANRILSAMRLGFGGHTEVAPGGKP